MKQKSIDLSRVIMTKIKKEKIGVQPRWHFVLGSFLLGFGMLATVVLAVYMIGMSLYRVRVHSSMNYLWFGREGQEAFWATFPWTFLILAVFSLMVGLRVIKAYDISYKVKWYWLVLSLVLGVMVAGMVMDNLGVNRYMSKQDLVKSLYVEYDDRQQWYKGKVQQVNVKRMTVTTMDAGRQVRVSWNEFTRLPFGGDFSKGEWVIIVGDWRGEDFVAEGIGVVGEP